MSRLNDLIQKLCPEGVLKSKVGSLCSTFRPKASVPRSDFLEQGEIPVVDQSQNFIAGFTNDTQTKISIGPCVVFGDHTRERKFVDFDFAAGADGTVILIPEDSVEPRFLFYTLSNLSISNRGYNRHWTVVREMTVSLPPLEVQREIVSILDKFTQLEAELEAELEARRLQYEETRNNLLNFDQDLSSHPLSELIREFCPEGVPHRNLGDLLENIPRGRRLTKSELPEGGTVPVFHGGLEPIGLTDKPNTQGMSVMVINVGASAGSVGWSEEPFWCSDGCFALPHCELILPKYLYYCALANQQFFVGKVRKAGIPTLAAGSVLSLNIPLPPLEIQREIVSILDKLDALVNDISYGLPAEIAARRKQYEYYRNKLLTFKELDAA